MNTSGFGDRINNIINEAVDTMDFGRLSRDINTAVRDAVFGSDEIKLSSERSKGAGFSGRLKSKDTCFSDLSGSAASSRGKIPVSGKPAGTYSGMVMIVCGCIGIPLFAIASAVSAGLAAFMLLGSMVPSIIYGCLAAACAGVTVKGVNIRKRLKRFREYLHVMNGCEFYEIKDLAAQTRNTDKYVKNDLEKMIDLRMFSEGHIDDAGQCFIGNNAMYGKYLEAKDNFERRRKEDAEQSERMSRENEQDRKLRMVLEKGRESVKSIRNANTALPGEEISRKLDELESLVKQIFARVEEKPSLLPDIKKFMDYYLPTTVKLVEVYTDFEKRPVQSSEIAAAKKEIEQTLDTIEAAFMKLLGELYEDTVMDVSTDISVLKTMFAKDGLADSDFRQGGI